MVILTSTKQPVIQNLLYFIKLALVLHTPFPTPLPFIKKQSVWSQCPLVFPMRASGLKPRNTVQIMPPSPGKYAVMKPFIPSDFSGFGRQHHPQHFPPEWKPAAIAARLREAVGRGSCGRRHERRFPSVLRGRSMPNGRRSRGTHRRRMFDACVETPRLPAHHQRCPQSLFILIHCRKGTNR